MRYIIIATDDSMLSDTDIAQAFGEKMFTINEKAWAVGTDILTCGSVRDRIKHTANHSCVVVKATDYNGYASKDLWEQLTAWGS